MYKRNRQGFSLVEAMLTTAVFSIITIVVFNMSSDFFKIYNTADSKQSINKEFIKTYSYINRDLSLSDVSYFCSYCDEKKNQGKRWFFFPSATDKQGLCQTSGNKIYWTRIFFYYVYTPDDECNVGAEDYREHFKYCPHKKLIRLSYSYLGYSESYFFCSALTGLCECTDLLTLPYDSTSFPSKLSHNIANYGERNTFQYSGKKIIADNILDLTVRTENSGVVFDMYFLRTEDANKKIHVGQTDLTSPEGKKFVEHQTWGIYPKN